MENKLPKKWIKKPLKDITQAIKDRGHVGVVPYLEIGDVDILRNTYQFTKKCSVKGCKQAKKNDILISRVRPTRGAIVRVQEDNLTVSSAFTILRNKDGIDDRYLLHYLARNKIFLAYLGENCTGTMYPTVAEKAILDYDIFLAPDQDQKRIADKLDSLLTKVNDVQSRLDIIPVILNRFRQSVLVAAFSGELTRTWRLRNKELNAEDDLALIREFILKSEITNREKNTFEEITKISLAFYKEQFAVPSSWMACCVGFIGIVNNGSTPSRKIAKYWKGSISWISSGEVRNNKINASREKITQEGLDNCSSKLFPAGTVLIAMIGEGKTRGQSAILNIDAVINQNIAAVQIAHGRINPEYLWYWFQYQYENNRSFGSGSGPKALNCQRVRELPFVFAPKAEQDQIVSKIKSSFSVLDGFIERYLKSKSYTDKLEQSILAKAFRGELVR